LANGGDSSGALDDGTQDGFLGGPAAGVARIENPSRSS
jgi:hypothetical protein